nr:hypothetical protein [Tanacetum cinerariifolium]
MGKDDQVMLTNYLTKARDDSGHEIIRPLFKETIKLELWDKALDEVREPEGQRKVVESYVPPITFPGRLTKEKEKEQFRKFFENLQQLSINIPFVEAFELELGELKPTCMCIELANKSTQYPMGIAENVIVKIGKFVFPIDFVMLDMEEHFQDLGHSWCDNRYLSSSSNDENPDIVAIITQQLQNLLPQIITQVTNNVNNANANGGNGKNGNGGNNGCSYKTFLAW